MAALGMMVALAFFIGLGWAFYRWCSQPGGNDPKPWDHSKGPTNTGGGPPYK